MAKSKKAPVVEQIEEKEITEVSEQTFDHTVTAEDLANNPELVEEGVKEGEVITIPSTEKADAEMQKNFEQDVVSPEALVISTGSISFSGGDESKEVDASLVKLKISYPEGYTGKKYYADGSITEVSEDSAIQFIEKGIAERVN